jgi:transposase-like protein
MQKKTQDKLNQVTKAIVSGATLEEACKKHKLSQATYYRYKKNESKPIEALKEYNKSDAYLKFIPMGPLDVDNADNLQLIREEVQRLKKENAILKKFVLEFLQ